MRKAPEAEDELRAEYNENELRGGVRGRYYERYQRGTNVVKLAPDVAAVFGSEAEVNEALRLLIRAARQSTGVAAPASKPTPDAQQT
jgi:hypothetical protein